MNYFDSMQAGANCFGALRITNKRTLDVWKKTGKYQRLIDEGYIYAEGCGRFRLSICSCTKCINNK